jgi:hypothetical protein
MVAAPTQADRLSTVKTTLLNALFTVTDKAEVAVNRILPPERRETLQQRFVSFATAHPLLATLLLSQIAFSGIPLLLFALFTVGVLVFSLVTALLLAVLTAVLFTAFCVGFAFLLLLPTLFLTTFAGVSVWFWAWGAYQLVKRFSSSKVDSEQLNKPDSGRDEIHEKHSPRYDQDATQGKQSTQSQSQGTTNGRIDEQGANKTVSF